jgi:hypothetical protein
MKSSIKRALNFAQTSLVASEVAKLRIIDQPIISRSKASQARRARSTSLCETWTKTRGTIVSGLIPRG